MKSEIQKENWLLLSDTTSLQALSTTTNLLTVQFSDSTHQTVVGTRVARVAIEQTPLTQICI